MGCEIESGLGWNYMYWKTGLPLVQDMPRMCVMNAASMEEEKEAQRRRHAVDMSRPSRSLHMKTVVRCTSNLRTRFVASGQSEGLLRA